MAAGLGGFDPPLASATGSPGQPRTTDAGRIEYSMPSLLFEDSTVQRELAVVYETALTNLIGINTAYAEPATYNRDGLVTYPPGTFVRAGGGYPLPQRWTRDAAVNAWNATSLLAPIVGRNTLWSVVNRQSGGSLVVQQGDGEWWDQIVWVLGAWDHYRLTGDVDFLTDAYETSVNTLGVRRSQNFNTAQGLFEGPSFMNDGISGYPSPPWQPGIDTSSVLAYPHSDVLMCLSTNCLYYGSYLALAGMARALGRHTDIPAYHTAAARLRASINRNFWRDDAGMYGYLIHGQGTPLAGQLDTRQEGSGLAFAVMLGVAGARRTGTLLANSHWQPHGVVNSWPHFARFSEQEPGRHNVSIWPMVHSMFGHAAAVGGRVDLFARAVTDLAQMISASDHSFYEVYNSVTGVPDGGWQAGNGSAQITQWTSAPNQAWSATGYLRMIYRGLFGLDFTKRGLEFAPSLPSGWGTVHLLGLRYRNMTLDVTLSGAGRRISSCRVDGRPSQPVLAATGTGHHTIQIAL
ncbi:MAG: MGH1-like glycoside hydrolase domain-containing protein [Acidimicrobiales bacterium]